MNQFKQLYKQVYKHNKLFDIDKKQKQNPLNKKGRRPNSAAVVGGALGDEGKGRVTDELTAEFLNDHKKVVHYRDNGGANAGHTVEVGQTRIALHQLGSGILQNSATVILGKEMVLHPEDLVTEIEDVKQAAGSQQIPADLKIDEMAALCLDTHRAFEAVLKMRSRGSKGATGRGISPAYADIVYRHPLRMRDLTAKNWQQKFKDHYDLYAGWVKGLGFRLAKLEAPRLGGDNVKVGSADEFLERLAATRKVLINFIQPVYQDLKQSWQKQTPMVFEKAQALGLDKRWGVYPDVTASNCGFDGIFSSTEGVVDPQQLAVRAAVIKATYTSSVGARRLPTIMNKKLADRIRKDASEFGATTGRPRDIAYLDLPMLSYLFKVGRVEDLVITHLDISYSDTPIKICVGYKINGKEVDYRPDQVFLNQVKPEFIELPPWDGTKIQKITRLKNLPLETLQYIAFISQSLQAAPFLLTIGPKRNQTIYCY
jgi:adenylosuccinate synthase